MTLDPNKIWGLLEERLAAETDPVVRRNLELVIAHGKAEATLDLDGVLATLCPNPRYVAHSSPDLELVNPTTTEGVRAFYQATIVDTDAHRIEHAVDRVIADRTGVYTEGVIKIAYPGWVLAHRGIEVDDPDAYYLYVSRMAIVWPVDPETGLLVGEESWAEGDGFAGIAERKISLDEVEPVRV
ncbi:hypothetical protein [Rhabdothermincola salaria]|uniref:hypothetical protein n=1 Tax=Rhabdothermincola salaria TaxID=2903142 RepID=UPI001E2D1824|nr:hypothetical protein [Rhabdothermincola salaria]MCD9623925.1 hypothetical protein [Rhabdothermincola salaria]